MSAELSTSAAERDTVCQKRPAPTIKHRHWATSAGSDEQSNGGQDCGSGPTSMPKTAQVIEGGQRQLSSAKQQNSSPAPATKHQASSAVTKRGVWCADRRGHSQVKATARAGPAEFAPEQTSHAPQANTEAIPVRNISKQMSKCNRQRLRMSMLRFGSRHMRHAVLLHTCP
jgi:hypothetical protein